MIRGTLTALLLAVLLSGCGGDPEEPELIGAGAIGGDLEPVADFVPEPGPPCDLESATLLHDADPNDFRAWDREVDGHRERVVVGIRRMGEAEADSAFDAFTRRFAACGRSAEGRTARLAEVATGGDRAGGYQADARDGSYRVVHAYAWAQAHEGTDDGHRGPALDYGYLVTVWLERDDDSAPSGDLEDILDAQLQQVPGY